jgi:PAS domain-containing protein
LPGLQGKSLAVLDGGVWEQLTQIVPGLTVAPYSTLEQALQAVADGRVYAYIGDAASADYLLKRKSFGDLELRMPLDLTYDLALATRLGDSELLSLLQKGLDRLGADELQEIWHRWPGVERPQQYAQEISSMWLWLPLILAWSALLVWGVYRYIARKEHLRHAKLKQVIQRFQRRERRLKEKLISLKQMTLDYRGESQQHRQRLSLIDEVMPSAAWVWEPAADECQWDERMYELYQQDPDRFEPTPEAILGLVHEDDRDQVASLFRLADGEDESRLSYRVALPDGGVRWLLDFSYYSVDQAAGAEQRIGLCWDITDYLNPSQKSEPLES